MTIPAYTTPTNAEEYKNAIDSIMAGKFLSYIPEEGWGYRTIDEVTGDSKEHAEV